MFISSPIYKQPKFDIIFVTKPTKFKLNYKKSPLAWLNKTLTIREDITKWHPHSKSVLIAGLYYTRKVPKLAYNKYYLRISQYAALRDYHKVFTHKLKNLAKILKNYVTVPTKFNYKLFVDSSPVYEKGYMLQAPHIFLGKHGLLQGPHGSKFLIGGISTNLSITELSNFVKQFQNQLLYPKHRHKTPKYLCATCNQCIKSCPTGALNYNGFEINIPLCISYLTVEAKGVIPDFLQKRMKNWLFGCDECQNTCPYNKIYQESLSQYELYLRFGKVLPTILYFRTAQTMSVQGFYKYFSGTPIIRMGYKKFKHRVNWYIRNMI